MKKLLLVVSFLLGITFNIMSDSSVTLAWCPSPDTTNNVIEGYRIYYGSANSPIPNWTPDIYDTNQPPCPGVILTNGSNWYRTYTNMVDVGNTLIVTISNLMVDPTYYFSVTAYDTNGLESDYSGEIMYKVPVVINPSNLPPTTTTNFQIIPKP